jgi:hypothetical protein
MVADFELPSLFVTVTDTEELPTFITCVPVEYPELLVMIKGRTMLELPEVSIV